MIWLSLTLLILGLYAARILQRHLHEKKLLRLREIAHTERMAALERDREWPDSAIPEVESALSSSTDSHANYNDPSHASLRWIRYTALAIGLAGLFGGMGTMVGLYFVTDVDAKGTWPLGMIPVFLGLGMLLFFYVSRRIADTSSSGQEKP